MPKAWPSRATAWPIAPSPMMPSVEPARSRIGWSKKQNWPASLPRAGDDVLAVADQRAAQRQDQREGVLGHGVAPRSCGCWRPRCRARAGRDVDDVVAGGGDRDHPQVGQPGERRARIGDLVGDRDRARPRAARRPPPGGASCSAHSCAKAGRVSVTDGPMVARSRKTIRVMKSSSPNGRAVVERGCPGPRLRCPRHARRTTVRR